MFELVHNFLLNFKIEQFLYLYFGNKRIPSMVTLSIYDFQCAISKLPPLISQNFHSHFLVLYDSLNYPYYIGCSICYLENTNLIGFKFLNL